MCSIALLSIFSIIYSPVIKVAVKDENSWTNIVESVRIIEQLNKSPSTSPLYEANEFQVHEPLLVVSELWNHFCSFS